MCNGYYLITMATRSQAFFDKFGVSFIFLNKGLDIVLFLYFYRFPYILLCIIVMFLSTNVNTSYKAL